MGTSSSASRAVKAAGGGKRPSQMDFAILLLGTFFQCSTFLKKKSPVNIFVRLY
jgi:hypothetical protein